MSADEKERYIAHEHMMNQWQEAVEMELAEERGMTKGLEIGEARGMEIGEARGREEGIELTAKRMKDKGFDIATISEATGLPETTISKL
jgi:predicted transposase/invertase (TIGR01784 family)